MTQDLDFVIDEGDDAGRRHGEFATLEDDVHIGAKFCLEQKGGGDGGLLRTIGAGAEQGAIELSYQTGGDLVIRDANSHRPLAATQ